MMNFIDLLREILYQAVQEKVKKYIKKYSLQRLLLNIVKECGEAKVDLVLKKRILNLPPDDIKPNLSYEKLRENLNDIFYLAFSDSSCKESQIHYVLEIYKKNAIKEALELWHLEENTELLLEEINNVNKSIEGTYEAINNVESKIDKIHNSVVDIIDKIPSERIHFIDELDDSKFYFYIIMELRTRYGEMDEEWEVELEDILEWLSENENISFQHFFDPEAEFFKVYINFEEPIVQHTFKEFIKRLSGEFCKRNIGIVSILANK